jgi:hypothetical protein
MCRSYAHTYARVYPLPIHISIGTNQEHLLSLISFHFSFLVFSITYTIYPGFMKIIVYILKTLS